MGTTRNKIELPCHELGTPAVLCSFGHVGPALTLVQRFVDKDTFKCQRTGPAGDWHLGP